MVAESEKSKHDMLRAMRKHIRENGITDFTDFQDWCDENNDRWSQALDSGLSSVIEKYIDGRFYFEKMPLEEILLQLARWYDLQVFWANEELKSYKFTGAVWRYYSIRESLDMIEKTTDVCFTVSGRTVTVNASL